MSEQVTGINPYNITHVERKQRIPLTNTNTKRQRYNTLFFEGMGGRGGRGTKDCQLPT